jgi:hypothetical protein
MLPYSDDRPARIGKSAIGILITTPIIGDFMVPEPRRRALGRSMMFAAAVPETAIQEHGNLGSWKDHVGGSAYAGYWWIVNPVT